MTWFGFLNCYKPAGMTSRDVVNLVQRRLRKTKVGHAGTLDPIAEGILVLGLGAAARLVTHVQSYPKRYTGEFRLGEHSPSEDTETEITRPIGLPVPDLETLEQAAATMVGRIEQTPSAYSAIHVNGKRAYERARQGEVFEMPSREVQVDSIVVDHYQYPNLRLTVQCGSGTYIRSIGSDLAKKAGSCAVMTSLTRTSVGPFDEKQSIDIETIKHQELTSHLLPATMAIEYLPKLVVTSSDVKKIYFGQSLEGTPDMVPSLSAIEHHTGATSQQHSALQTNPSSDIAAVTRDGALLALLRPKRGLWHPYRVFPPAKEVAEQTE